MRRFLMALGWTQRESAGGMVDGLESPDGRFTADPEGLGVVWQEEGEIPQYLQAEW